jgi:hypothetical protein
MSTQSAPGLPAGSNQKAPAPTDNKPIWILYYRQGNAPMPQTKFFQMNGTWRQVVDKCKDHCTKLNMRFVRAEPFMSDLRADEQRYMDPTGELADN